ncbi:MAG: Ig-like domain-containing protein, partial [Candidatus Uhrbacteria bacterium]|nr:Ig-like domain-containing protein [Candidatus Uhrbacteria bacterium]
PAYAQSGGQAVNFTASTFSANKYVVRADGIDSAQVNVTVKNDLYGFLEGAQVELWSSRGDRDEIIVLNGVTNSSGRASFLIRSLRNGTSSITATVNGQLFPKTLEITFEQGLALQLPVGALIKIPDDSDVETLNDTAVYYYASNGKRYVFPNEKTYFTWYGDFSAVRIIPIDQMALVPIGGNVTYRPASRLVKFQTDPKVYLPTKGGVLRWAKTEDIVRTWFGSQWNTFVDDISEGFYVNYIFGTPIEGPYDVSLQVIADTARTVNENLGLGQP